MPILQIFKMIHLFEIRSFQSSHLSLPFPYFFRRFGKLDGSQGRHLLAVRTRNVMSCFVFVTVYLLLLTIYLWNFNFLRVRDGHSKSVTRNFLKDTPIFVKQLQIKVWHNGQVCHSLKCCFSSALKFLFKGAATS